MVHSYDFEAFEELSKEEIFDILVRHYNNCREELRKIEEKLSVDTRSQSLKNRGKEHSQALTALTDLLDDLGIDTDELE